MLQCFCASSRRRRILSLALLACALAACADLSPRAVVRALTPYRVEVVQGNVVTQEMGARLQTGQTRDQVRNILGSPLLMDPFHANRWDYVFTIRRQGTQPQQRTVTVYFSGDRVSKFDASDLPSEREFVASIDTSHFSGKVPVLQLDEAATQALPLPAKPAAQAASAPASGPVRSYPPLEPVGS